MASYALGGHGHPTPSGLSPASSSVVVLHDHSPCTLSLLFMIDPSIAGTFLIASSPLAESKIPTTYKKWPWRDPSMHPEFQQHIEHSTAMAEEQQQKESFSIVASHEEEAIVVVNEGGSLQVTDAEEASKNKDTPLDKSTGGSEKNKKQVDALKKKIDRLNKEVKGIKAAIGKALSEKQKKKKKKTKMATSLGLAIRKLRKSSSSSDSSDSSSDSDSTSGLSRRNKGDDFDKASEGIVSGSVRKLKGRKQKKKNSGIVKQRKSLRSSSSSSDSSCSKGGEFPQLKAEKHKKRNLKQKLIGMAKKEVAKKHRKHKISDSSSSSSVGGPRPWRKSEKQKNKKKELMKLKKKEAAVA
ncbi:hypothetical protein OPV22_012015 [Ensete ventricosum]|uniref:Uncharacterized protein n=1 Tax=Ensete ventricosum TaxID=4639 RepID=A0AAV8PKA8_ENSVE|nr:hypothetical protein OPV22_012015 [Ensete ventricosum]